MVTIGAADLVPASQTCGTGTKMQESTEKQLGTEKMEKQTER